MIDSLIDIDKNLFLFLNSDGAPWLDKLMWYFSKTWFWFPVDFILLYTIFKRFSLRQFFWIILAFSLVVLIADQVSSGLLKDLVHRLRPSREPALEGLVHLVKDENGNHYIGGKFGFVSSHAANYSGVVLLFILINKGLRPLFIALLVLWVLLVSYSRIYLGVHYPGDILGGWLVGCSGALLVFLAMKKFILKPRLS